MQSVEQKRKADIISNACSPFVGKSTDTEWRFGEWVAAL
jgi:hypothetical protein